MTWPQRTATKIVCDGVNYTIYEDGDELPPRSQVMNSYKSVESVNSDVNAGVSWMSDSEQFGVPEFWCEAKSGFDDCDGYALLKRHY